MAWHNSGLANATSSKPSVRVAASKFKPLHRQRPSRLFSSVFFTFLIFRQGDYKSRCFHYCFLSLGENCQTYKIKKKRTIVEISGVGAINYSRYLLLGHFSIVHSLQISMQSNRYFLTRKLFWQRNTCATHSRESRKCKKKADRASSDNHEPYYSSVELNIL